MVGDAIPQLSLMIDLSHYVVAGKLNGESAAAEACFDELLARTAGIQQALLLKRIAEEEWNQTFHAFSAS